MSDYELKEVFDINKFTIVGTPTITSDGIASGGSEYNYIKKVFADNLLSSDFECIVSVKLLKDYTEDTGVKYCVYSKADRSGARAGINLRYEGVYNSLMVSWDNTLDSDTTNTIIGYSLLINGQSNPMKNTQYFIKFKKSGITYSISYSSDGKTFITPSNCIVNYTYATLPVINSIELLRDSRNCVETDLKYFSITVDGVEVFKGTKTVVAKIPPDIISGKSIPIDYKSMLDELQDYYANLLIIQYHNKPKAKALIKNLVKYLYADMMLFKIRDGFNILNPPYAIGKQLDCIGEWVGVNRIYDAGQPAYPWFSYVDWNQTTTDAGQGGFQDWDDPIAQDGGFIGWDDLVAGKNKTTLADDLFLALIKLKIIKNVSTHTMDDLATRLYQYFGDGIYTTFGKYVYNPDVFTVVGSPTITADGIASGFGNSDYVKNTGLSFGSNPWEITDKFTFSSSGSNQALISGVTNASAPLLYISATGMQLHIPSSVGTWGWQLTNASHTFTVGNTYYYKVGWDGTNYYIKVSDNLGSTWTTLQTMAGTAMLGGSGSFDLAIGSNPAQSGRYVTGSIDLKQFSITIDGETVFSGQKYDGRYLTYNYTQDYKTIMEVGKIKNCIPVPQGMIVSYNLV